MTQPACKHCGHPRAQHRDDMAGMCVGCKCEGYEAPIRHISSEARRLAMTVIGLDVIDVPKRTECIAELVQDLLDQRDSWQREACQLQKQRDDARNRGVKLADALADADEQIGRLTAALEAHAALSTQGEQS